MPEIKLGKEKASVSFVTPKGEITGFSAIFQPSVKFNKEGMYNANILLSKEDGEKVEELVKNVQTEQFKNYAKKGKDTKSEIKSIKPYTTVDDDGNETPDSEGRYILKTKAKAYIKDNQVGKKIAVFDAKGRPVKSCKLGEGSVVRLKLDITGYTVAGKVGVSVTLAAVQIIKLVEYASTASFDGFDVEEDGFDADTLEEETQNEEKANGDEEEAF